MFENLLRSHIKRLLIHPEGVLKHEADRKGGVLLDANENPFGSPAEQYYNRYSDGQLEQFRKQLAQVKRVDPAQVFLSNGTESVLHRIFSAFCEPEEDNILICTPTSFLYERVALLQNINVKKVPLKRDFQLDIEGIASGIDHFTKAIVLCSPNNPSGNSLHFHDIEILLHNFDGLLIVDEAYINYSRQRSLIAVLEEYPNLIIVQTLSIAWGLAGIRIAMAIAHTDIVRILNQISPKHSISQPGLEIASRAINQLELINSWIKDTVSLRNYLALQLEKLPYVACVYPSDANFILVSCKTAAGPLIDFLKANGIAVGIIPDLPNCLRIGIGTLNEIDQLMYQLHRFADLK